MKTASLKNLSSLIKRLDALRAIRRYSNPVYQINFGYTTEEGRYIPIRFISDYPLSVTESIFSLLLEFCSYTPFSHMKGLQFKITPIDIDDHSSFEECVPLCAFCHNLAVILDRDAHLHFVQRRLIIHMFTDAI